MKTVEEAVGFRTESWRGMWFYSDNRTSTMEPAQLILIEKHSTYKMKYLHCCQLVFFR